MAERSTPWKVVKVYGYSGYHNHDIRDAENDSIILDVDSEEGPGFDEADARLIVRAVNAHEQLVAALRAMLAYYEPGDGCDPPNPETCPACRARAALEAADQIGR
jgi:hypothetical protein